MLTAADVESLKPKGHTDSPVSKVEVRGIAGWVSGKNGGPDEYWVSDPSCQYLASSTEGSELVLTVEQFTYGSQDAGEIDADELGTSVFDSGICENGQTLQETYDVDSREQAVELLRGLVDCRDGIVVAGSDGFNAGAMRSRGGDPLASETPGGGLYCLTADNCFLVTDDLLFNFGWEESSKYTFGPSVTYDMALATATLLASKA